MPRIKTSTGYFRYHPIPIYCGFAVLDRVIEEENLLLFSDIMKKHNVPFAFLGGSLLGAVREHDFIEHDDDIDLGINIKYLQNVIDILHEFVEVCFQVARYDRRCIISIIRKGQYIDLAFFEDYNSTTYSCCGWLVLKEFLDNLDYIEFKGKKYLAPRDYENYLSCEFGPDWMTPIKYFNFNQPWWKVQLIKVSELIKAYLPGFLYFPLKRKAEAKVAQNYQARIDRYNNRKNI